jgi:hypothetical protein
MVLYLEQKQTNMKMPLNLLFLAFACICLSGTVPDTGVIDQSDSDNRAKADQPGEVRSEHAAPEGEEFIMNIGKGCKGRLILPDGWKKELPKPWPAPEETIWRAPGNKASIGILLKDKYDLTGEEILKESLSSVKYYDSEKKVDKQDLFTNIWIRGTVDIGPRKEGRMWVVGDFQLASKVVLIEAIFNLPTTQEMIDTVEKALQTIAYKAPDPSGN